MNPAIRVFFFFLPVIVSCQTLPIAELKENGLTKAEIDKTISLQGENGVNDFYLIFRQRNISHNPRATLFYNYFELYTPEGDLIPLAEYKHNQSELLYFDFLEEEIILVERIFGLRRSIRISRYNIKGKLNRVINAEIPCSFGNECEWIKYEESKLAFFTNLKENEGLQQSSIYEYDWEENKTKIIFGKLPLVIDARTGRNFTLSDVKYNRENKKFEYGQ